jgi:O-antigen/teichoic acid export membrane protein
VIADLGLYTITVREITKYQDDPKMVQKISSNILTLRTLSGIIIIGSSLTLSPFLSGYDTPMAYIGILIAGFFTLMGLINSSLMSYLQAILKTEFSFIANISGKFTTF